MTHADEEDAFELDAQMVRATVGRDADRVSLVLYGLPVDALDGAGLCGLVDYASWERSEDDLRRHSVRNLVLEVAALAILYGGIDDRLGVRPAWGDVGYLDAVLDAQAVGTRSGYEALCEALEVSWHDMRLTTDEGVAVVEGVERVRVGLRRLEACGVEFLHTSPGRGPAS